MWRKKLDPARKASGVDLTAHELRHVAASILFAAKGDDWGLIQEQMGHESAQETERIYKHVFRGDRSAVARMLGAKIDELRMGDVATGDPDQW
nr:tyrosine-type recombinase/integrase [Cellulomonas sp. IC4_254]